MKRLGGWWNGLEGHLRQERYTLDLVTNFEIRGRIVTRQDADGRSLTFRLHSPCCGTYFGDNGYTLNCTACGAAMPAGFEPPHVSLVIFNEGDIFEFPHDLRLSMEHLARWRMDPITAQLAVQALEESLGNALAHEWKPIKPARNAATKECRPLEFTWTP